MKEIKKIHSDHVDNDDEIAKEALDTIVEFADPSLKTKSRISLA